MSTTEKKLTTSHVIGGLAKHCIGAPEGNVSDAEVKDFLKSQDEVCDDKLRKGTLGDSPLHRHIDWIATQRLVEFAAGNEMAILHAQLGDNPFEHMFFHQLDAKIARALMEAAGTAIQAIIEAFSAALDAERGDKEPIAGLYVAAEKFRPGFDEVRKQLRVNLDSPMEYDLELNEGCSDEAKAEMAKTMGSAPDPAEFDPERVDPLLKDLERAFEESEGEEK